MLQLCFWMGSLPGFFKTPTLSIYLRDRQDIFRNELLLGSEKGIWIRFGLASRTNFQNSMIPINTLLRTLVGAPATLEQVFAVPALGNCRESALLAQSQADSVRVINTIRGRAPPA